MRRPGEYHIADTIEALRLLDRLTRASIQDDEPAEVRKPLYGARHFLARDLRELTDPGAS